MRISTPTTLIATLVLGSSSTAQGAGLRPSTANEQRQGHRGLNQAFDNVSSAMKKYYAGGHCTTKTAKRSKQTTVECSMPGSSATLTALGKHFNPQTLEKCQLQTGGNQKCKTYDFASHSMTTPEVTAAYFPSGGHNPRSQEGDYLSVLSMMIPHYDGDCSISLDSGNTQVSCSMMGSTADFTAKGTMEQVPKKLKICVLKSGGNQSCNTYNFNGSQDTQTILTEAFGRPQSSTVYQTVLNNMIPYYKGQCSMNTDQGNTDVSCSMPGSNAKLTAKGTHGQSPMQLKKCMIGTGGNQSCQTYNFNGSMKTHAILAEAFPKN